MQNAPREHSAILSSFIKLQFVFKTFVLSIFEWPLKTGFIVNITAWRADEGALFFSVLFNEMCLFVVKVGGRSTYLQVCKGIMCSSRL